MKLTVMKQYICLLVYMYCYVLLLLLLCTVSSTVPGGSRPGRFSDAYSYGVILDSSSSIVRTQADGGGHSVRRVLLRHFRWSEGVIHGWFVRGTTRPRSRRGKNYRSLIDKIISFFRN